MSVCDWLHIGPPVLDSDHLQRLFFCHFLKICFALHNLSDPQELWKYGFNLCHSREPPAVFLTCANTCSWARSPVYTSLFYAPCSICKVQKQVEARYTSSPVIFSPASSAIATRFFRFFRLDTIFIALENENQLLLHAWWFSKNILSTFFSVQMAVLE